MKAFFKSFASAGLAVLFGVGTLGGTAALAEMSEHRGENVPEEIKTENVALGKEVTFRSLMDMNETLTMYSYFPNNGGIDGTGCYDISAGGNVSYYRIKIPLCSRHQSFPYSLNRVTSRLSEAFSRIYIRVYIFFRKLFKLYRSHI